MRPGGKIFQMRREKDQAQKLESQDLGGEREPEGVEKKMHSKMEEQAVCFQNSRCYLSCFSTFLVCMSYARGIEPSVHCLSYNPAFAF